MSDKSVITVVGKDRVGIVFDVAKILAENQVNIVNLSQQIMDDYFTMILLVNTSACTISRGQMLDVLAQASKDLHLDIRMQDKDLFNAMHRI
ncbi:MAG: ACT domain-containing protein [Neisseria sp.]|nr:ACT domain-containing protein [Neisseria sp.]